MRQVCDYLDGEVDMQEAMIVFADADSGDFGSLASLPWSSCATMSAGPAGWSMSVLFRSASAPGLYVCEAVCHHNVST